VATMTSEHTKQRSTLTVLGATWRSRRVPIKTRQPLPDPSGYRVGSFHLPAGDARAVPMLFQVIGIAP
jgi:hypothetical protein